MNMLAPLRRVAAAAAALLLAAPLSMAWSMSPKVPTKAPPKAPPPAPRCSFTAQPDAQGQVVLHFTLRNDGASELRLLRWGSPFEGGWFGRFVRVHAGSNELPFQGAMRKRGEPAASDYLLLPAGQQLESTLTLNEAFVLPAAGSLKIGAAWRWHDVMTEDSPPRPRSTHQGLDQDCGEATLTR
ncbi:hypothetical protein [Roseateles sp. BYS96W]|uniref:Copper chaperone PCu(A)C n=1 Tax=Pelomonas nitida TaxID=3299027 RepID=A0ABW7G7B0_9BURK